MPNNLTEICKQLENFSQEALLIFSYDDYPSAYKGFEKEQDLIEVLAKAIIESNSWQNKTGKADSADELRNLISGIQGSTTVDDASTGKSEHYKTIDQSEQSAQKRADLERSSTGGPRVFLIITILIILGMFLCWAVPFFLPGIQGLI